MKDYLNTCAPLHFIFPADGDCLNNRDGEEREGMLFVPAAVCAPAGARIEINEIPAEFDGKAYTARVPLRCGRTSLTAVNRADGTRATVAVWRLKGAEGGYRLSSDDNILFLQNITENKDRYASLFDDPYLAVYKKAHDLAGAKVHLNLFYDTSTTEGFAKERGYFDLSMMTDKFKEEWESNSDWLKLSFHARNEKPDNPYTHVTMKRMEEDVRLVNEQIVRFAGKRTLSEVTTVHFGDVSRGGLRALRNLGYRALAGYFEMADGEPLVAYQYPKALTEHVGARDFWKDNEEDIFFSRIDAVINSRPTAEENISALKEALKNVHRAGFVEIMIHEQYFYPDYKWYLKNFEDIVLKTCLWLNSQGYEGRLLGQLLKDTGV